MCNVFFAEADVSNIESIIKEYFNSRYTYSEICKMLAEKWNYNISVQSLKRLLKTMNLKRKNIIESSNTKFVSAIIEEVYDCGFNLGYRSLW